MPTGEEEANQSSAQESKSPAETEMGARPEPIKLVDESPGEGIELGQPPPKALAPVERDPSDLEEAGHRPPKQEMAPSRPPSAAVPPPSKPPEPQQSGGDTTEQTVPEHEH